MTEINFNNKSRALEISVRIFTDDFEKTLRKNCGCKVDLLTATERSALEPLIKKYVDQHLQVKVDGRNQPLEFAGYQQEEESTWNYFLIPNVSQLKKIEIINTLLYDYREEQVNMLHIKANGKDYTDKLDFPNKFLSIQL